MATELNMKLLLRRGTFADTYVLDAGEPGYHTSTKEFKIGDGITGWKELSIANKTQIDALIKVVSDELANFVKTDAYNKKVEEIEKSITDLTAIVDALDNTYATDAELKGVKEALEEAIGEINGTIGAYGDIVTHNVSEFDAAGAAQTVADNVAETLKSYQTKAETTEIVNGINETISGVAEDVAELTTYVGEIPETATAKNIVAYVQEKTAGIATDAALEELTNKVEAINNEDTGILAQAKAYTDEEDVFEIDMNTINSLGGIGAGVNLNGLTTHEVLKKLLYPYVDATVGNATGSPNGGTYEKGVTKTITQVSISITKKSEPITSVALYNGSTLIEEKTGDAVKNGGTITFTGLSVVVPTDGNQLTVKVTYPGADGAAKTVEKKTTAMTFLYPYYYGVCGAADEINADLVLGLTKDVSAKGTKTYSYTTEAQRMVIAYPKAHGLIKLVKDGNGLDNTGAFGSPIEVSVTGTDGTAQAYYVYANGVTSCSAKMTFSY